MPRQVFRWSANLKLAKTDLKDKQRPGEPRAASTDAILAR